MARACLWDRLSSGHRKGPGPATEWPEKPVFVPSEVRTWVCRDAHWATHPRIQGLMWVIGYVQGRMEPAWHTWSHYCPSTSPRLPFTAPWPACPQGRLENSTILNCQLLRHGNTWAIPTRPKAESALISAVHMSQWPLSSCPLGSEASTCWREGDMSSPSPPSLRGLQVLSMSWTLMRIKESTNHVPQPHLRKV